MNISQKHIPDIGEYQKVIKIKPKYIFINQTNHKVMLKHSNLNEPLLIQSKEREPILIPNTKKKNYEFIVRFDHSLWSEPIDISQPGFSNFSIQKRDVHEMIHLHIEKNSIENSFYIIL